MDMLNLKSNKYLDLNGLAIFKENIGNMFPVYIKNITLYSSDWLDNKITLNCSLIKSNSIINIYYSEISKVYVESFNLSYIQGDGFIQISAENEVLSDLYIEVIEIINPVSYITIDKG